MRILVLGATGMLGHEILKSLKRDFQVAGTIRDVIVHDALRQLIPTVPIYCGVQTSNLLSIEYAIAAWRPDAIINCIGIVKQIKGDAIEFDCH